MIKRRTLHVILRSQASEDSNIRSVRSLSNKLLLTRIIQYCGLENDLEGDRLIVPELNELCYRLLEGKNKTKCCEQ